MAVWAYVCRSCEGDPPAKWYTSAALVAEMPAPVRIIRVKVGSEWRCAIVDRDQAVSVDQMLVRDAIASSEDDCPGCGERLAERARSTPDTVEHGARQALKSKIGSVWDASVQPRASSGAAQAAAISLQGRRLVVVLVSRDLVRSGGEADMAIETLASSFGGVPVVLVAQEDDGSPCYHGDAELIRLLRDIPLERLPWKEYPLG